MRPESRNDDEAGDVPARLIEKLGLVPHPEGGWYRQTWRAPLPDGSPPGARPSATAIHFLLEQHQRSHWHAVDASEVWLWHAGAPVILGIAPDARTAPVEWRLGGDVLAGDVPQAIVPVGHWQAARPLGGWALVSCVVSPGFDFAGFTLAAEGWEPGVNQD